MGSPSRTMVPGRTRLVMTRELLFWPARRGVEIVVASTASTDPERRSDFTKSRRFTVELASRVPDGVGDDRCARTAKAPAAATMATRRAAIGQRKRLDGLGKPAPDIRKRARRIGWSIRVRELYLTTGNLDTE